MSTALCYLHPDCRAVPELAAECLRGQRANATAWRAKWLPAMRTARWLERKAIETGLPFEVRPDWFPPAIDWAEFNQTLEQFEERVRLVSEQFGQPRELKVHEIAYGTHAPDLIATWNMTPPPWEKSSRLEIKVRGLTPVGLKPTRRPKGVEYGATKLIASDAAKVSRLAKKLVLERPAESK